MRFWIVKGRPSRNDLQAAMSPGRAERWVTRRPPRDWAVGDGVFLWEAAPALRLLGLGRVTATRTPNPKGDTFFDLTYLTPALEAPLTMAALRSDAVVGGASFLKAGAAGTLFPLTERQARRLLQLVRRQNPNIKAVEWGDQEATSGGTAPIRALSVRQPWAELIMRGAKTIEVRSRQTHIRGRVHIYASLGDVDADDETRVRRRYGVDAQEPPRGVLVGTVEIVGCRRLRRSDSSAAAFPVLRGSTDFAWLLARPVRAPRMRKPTRHPQPTFFTPF